MGQIKFHLKNPKSKKETQIFFEFFHNYKRLRYYTGEYIVPLAWDFKENRPYKGIKFPYNQEIALQLSKYEYVLKNLVSDFTRNKVDITPDLLRKHLDTEFKIVSSNNQGSNMVLMTFTKYIESYISDCESGKRLTPKGTRYKGWTLKGYKTLLYHLDLYSKSRRKKIDFADITIDFYDDILQYFQDNDYAQNTIGKHLKNIKVLMAASFEDGIHNNQEFKRKRFKVVSEESKNIYLTEEELDRMYNLDLSKNPRLERVRDLFIIASYTGLRFADLVALNETNFYIEGGKYYIKTITQKTNIEVMVPLKKRAIEVFHKYDQTLPRSVANQNMNKYLKEIGQLAQINTKESKPITKGGRIQLKTYEKWMLITTHTARRSAATNMFLAGFRAQEIMKITGHKTEKSFMKYIKNSPEENAFKMAQNSYFAKEYENESNLRIVG